MRHGNWSSNCPSWMIGVVESLGLGISAANIFRFPLVWSFISTFDDFQVPPILANGHQTHYKCKAWHWKTILQDPWCWCPSLLGLWLLIIKWTATFCNFSKSVTWMTSWFKSLSLSAGLGWRLLESFICTTYELLGKLWLVRSLPASHESWIPGS